ncbi:hypothetical protein ACFHYQ_26590 [Sphaerimonospora cavernae]|uniref:Uncharacterized protein n=1 Tax=Sphaerimonospora cavernae TaxID=1740611 RepID=A0ABV6UCG5_9ACTN
MTLAPQVGLASEPGDARMGSLDECDDHLFAVNDLFVNVLGRYGKGRPLARQALRIAEEAAALLPGDTAPPKFGGVERVVPTQPTVSAAERRLTRVYRNFPATRRIGITCEPHSGMSGVARACRAVAPAGPAHAPHPRGAATVVGGRRSSTLRPPLNQVSRHSATSSPGRRMAR